MAKTAQPVTLFKKEKRFIRGICAEGEFSKSNPRNPLILRGEKESLTGFLHKQTGQLSGGRLACLDAVVSGLVNHPLAVAHVALLTGKLYGVHARRQSLELR